MLLRAILYLFQEVYLFLEPEKKVALVFFKVHLLSWLVYSICKAVYHPAHVCVMMEAETKALRPQAKGRLGFLASYQN